MIDLDKYIKEKFDFLKSKKILLAFSGGLDSTVLVHVFSKIFPKENLAVAHVNFLLRGKESDGDRIFTEEFALSRGLKYFSKEFDTRKYARENTISIEMAARELRYQWFEELLEAHEFDFVAVAHHADDNLETFLLNLVRGTGLSGLRGMKEQNNSIIRPFLKFSREELEFYAKENKLQWREDSSNNSEDFKRNKLRHTVVPVLKELNPSLLIGFEKTIEKLKFHENIYLDLFEKFKHTVLSGKAELRIDIEKVLHHQSYELFLGDLLKEYGFNNSEDILEALNSQPGKEFFSKEYRLIKDRGYFILKRIDQESNINKYLINLDAKHIKAPIELNIERLEKQNVSISKNKNEEVFDLDKLNEAITIRKWRNGDYFYPTGMIGKKKLSKYFKDEKMSLFDKENQWVLCSGDSVVWVIGRRADRRFLASGESSDLVKITIL